MLMPETEHSFTVKGLNLTAKSWGNPDDLPVLALHGWLDNAHSFKPLAQNIDNIYLVAIDLAGHGKSDHRSLDSGYNIWQDIADVFAIADALGLKQFYLMGHSRGASIAHLSAGTFPKRVKGLVLIDSFAPPQYTPAQETPQQLAKAIKAYSRYSRLKRKHYDSTDQAVSERATVVNKLSEASARLLAERGIKKLEGGFIWSSDPRLQAPSEIRLSEQQCQAFIDRVSCTTLVITGSTEFSQTMAQAYYKLAGNNPLYSLVQLEGLHHLHMETESIEGVLEQLNKFFNEFI